MDYNKIGKFITEERKKQKLTQAKLAEKIYVSEKTISKWENGNGIPDTNSLTKLSQIFNVSLNELLNGERIDTENYTRKAEEQLLALEKEKEFLTKKFLSLEIIIGLLAVITFVPAFIIAIYLIESFNLIALGVSIIVVGSLIVIFILVICLWIEQKIGYYVCKKCNHKYIPTFNQVLWSMHFGRTRFMKCPKCNKSSWSKKVIK